MKTAIGIVAGIGVAAVVTKLAMMGADSLLFSKEERARLFHMVAK